MSNWYPSSEAQVKQSVFRGYPPEFIELDIAPDSISPATRADLEAEIQYLQQMREVSLQQMLDSIRVETVTN